MPVPIGVIVDGLTRLAELVKRLVDAGRSEATDEEVKAATALRKGRLADLEAELERRRRMP